MSEPKNLKDAVAEVKKNNTENNTVYVDMEAYDQYVSAAITGLLSSNRPKNVAQVAAEIAAEAMIERSKYGK